MCINYKKLIICITFRSVQNHTDMKYLSILFLMMFLSSRVLSFDAGSSAQSDLDQLNEVYFPFNSDQPEESSLPILQQLVQILNNNKDIKVEIAGFTDHIGDELFNKGLAKRRSLTVRNYLISNGIAGNRIKTIGYGEKMPVIISTESDVFKVNRRVEFNFSK